MRIVSHVKDTYYHFPEWILQSHLLMCSYTTWVMYDFNQRLMCWVRTTINKCIMSSIDSSTLDLHTQWFWSIFKYILTNSLVTLIRSVALHFEQSKMLLPMHNTRCNCRQLLPTSANLWCKWSRYVYWIFSGATDRVVGFSTPIALQYLCFYGVF